MIALVTSVLVREHLLLGQPQRLGPALEVDQGLDDALDRRPKHPVEPVAEVRVDAAFEEQELHQRVVDDPPEVVGARGTSWVSGPGGAAPPRPGRKK